MNMDICSVLIDFTVKLVDFDFEIIFSNNFLSCSPRIKGEFIMHSNRKSRGSSSEK